MDVVLGTILPEMQSQVNSIKSSQNIIMANQKELGYNVLVAYLRKKNLRDVVNGY